MRLNPLRLKFPLSDFIEYVSATTAVIDASAAKTVRFANSLPVCSENNLTNAKTDLNFTLGIDINTDLEPEEESLEIQRVELEFDDLIEDALQNRVDYKAAQDNVKSAKANITISRSDYYPQVSFNADYNWFDVKFPDSKKDLDEFDSYSFSINMRMNLFLLLRGYSGSKRPRGSHTIKKLDFSYLHYLLTFYQRQHPITAPV